MSKLQETWLWGYQRSDGEIKPWKQSYNEAKFKKK